MMRHPMQSSAITSAGYADGVLELEFSNGRVHQYTGVSQEDFDYFAASKSKGKHFGTEIRDKFPHTRIDDVAETETQGAP